MTSVAAIKTILEADATLIAAASGGVYDFAELGRLGLNRTTTPAAFDSDGIIKPCVVVRSRSVTPDGFLNDDGDRSRSAREMVGVWFYEDVGYSNIDAMRDRVYTLLHAVQLAGSFICHWNGDLRNQRDDDLDACVERSEYEVRLLRVAA